jgi:hypothetical protein
MQAWEYSIVTFENGKFHGLYSKDGTKDIGESDGYLVMNDLGAAGWEAVCMIPGAGTADSGRLLLKRPAETVLASKGWAN